MYMKMCLCVQSSIRPLVCDEFSKLHEPQKVWKALTVGLSALPSTPRSAGGTATEMPCGNSVFTGFL